MMRKPSELSFFLAVVLGMYSVLLGFDPWTGVCAGALVWLGFRLRRYS